MDSTDEKYWAEYDGLQNAKHQLLRSYLGGWFPILASFNGRVNYIDCHAGRGRHATGQEGSPILAIRILLNHKQRNRILENTEVNFIFFELKRANYDQLTQEIGLLGTLPPNIVVQPIQGDYATALQKTIVDLRSNKHTFAPFFAFVDPYGFTLSMSFLNDLLSFPCCELLINFMYRYVDMALTLPAQATNMDLLFGCAGWRAMPQIGDPDLRAKKTIALFSSQLRARYVTHSYMRAKNGALKYVLIHATNHKKGRELMKDALWSLTPDGSFTANERDLAEQLVLIELEPNLAPLKNSLWSEFSGKQISMNELEDWLLSQTYTKKHLHIIVRDYRKQGIITCDGCEGRFAFNKNPIVTFPPKRPPSS